MADLLEDELEPGEEIDFAGIVIEDQLLDHLATPEGCSSVWKDGLDPETVEDSDIRLALEFVLDYMHEHREPPPVAILSDETGYDEFRVPQVPIEYVMEKLRDGYRRKHLRAVTTKIGRLSGDPAEALSYGLRELSAIQVVTAGKSGNLSSDDMLSFLDRYEERLEDPRSGISFGYPDMDRLLGGLRRGELAFVLGRPKRYKSWQLLKSADAAWETGLTGVVQTMEITSEDMLDRWVCMRAGLNWSKFKGGLLGPDDYKLVRETHEEVQSFEHKIHFLRPQPGSRNVAYLVGTALDLGADVMYVDQLSMFDDAKSDDRSWLKIGKICEQLHDACDHFPIYVAAQFNREAASLGELADLAKIGLSDFIGQAADILLGLYASGEMHDNKLLHFGVVEARSFERASWELKVELNEASNFKTLKRLTDKEHDGG